MSTLDAMWCNISVQYFYFWCTPSTYIISDTNKMLCHIWCRQTTNSYCSTMCSTRC